VPRAISVTDSLERGRAAFGRQAWGDAYRHLSVADRGAVIFVGDSPNDAPMFAHFPNSVGVANIRGFADAIEHLPRYVTVAPSARGFVEFANRLLGLRRG